MDPIANPYSPGAGSPPPELVGRQEILEQSRILFGRVRLGRSEKSMLLTGLRGVGKTVLLNEIERIAIKADYSTVIIEAHEDKPFTELLAPYLRRLLFEFNRQAGVGNKVRQALAVLKSFLGVIKLKYGDIELGLDIEPQLGSADSGDLEVDLPNLFEAIALAAVDCQKAIVILIDEIQYLKKPELSALIMAMHKMQQRQLPLVLVGAGLPTLPGFAGESKSYAERLFSFPNIGPLSESDAVAALSTPAKAAGVEFSDKALCEIAKITQGYPYFLQEWGYQTWNHAVTSPIELDVVKQASDTVKRRLDENFFRVRFDRLTHSEKIFLRAMAHLGPGPYRTGDVADARGVKISSLGPVRAKLIHKGMIFSPAHGEIAFTVPLFDKYMCRVMPEFQPKA